MNRKLEGMSRADLCALMPPDCLMHPDPSLSLQLRQLLKALTYPASLDAYRRVANQTVFSTADVHAAHCWMSSNGQLNP